MALVLNGSGSITGLSAGGLPDGCITADDLATGVGGKVLQVVQATTDTEVTIATNTHTATGLSASITPSSTSSKILVHVHQPVYMEHTNYWALGALHLYRDSTNILPSGNATGGGYSLGYYLDVSGWSGWTAIAFQMYSPVYLDSPNTTSSVTYSTKGSTYGQSMVLQKNQSATNSTSSIVLMEIAG